MEAKVKLTNSQKQQKLKTQHLRRAKKKQEALEKQMANELATSTRYTLPSVVSDNSTVESSSSTKSSLVGCTKKHNNRRNTNSTDTRQQENTSHTVSQNKAYKAIMDFERKMKSVKHKCCPICQEVSLCSKFVKDQCSSCNNRKISPEKMCIQPTWTDKEGKLHYEQPMALTNLTLAELMLIQITSPCVPLQYIRYNNFGINGHVTTYPQDIDEVCYMLPRLPKNVKLVRMVHKYQASIGGPLKSKVYTVRRAKVLRALYWLKEYNVQYQDIEIDEQNLAWMGDSDEKEMPGIFEASVEETEEVDNDKDLGPAPSQVVEPRESQSEEDMPLYGTTPGQAVPIPSKKDKDMRKIFKDAAMACKDGSKATMLWPEVSAHAASEYDVNLKLFCTSFPDLFPGGVGDINDAREKKIGIAEWARHLMLYKDGRFARHKLFPFYVFNYMARHRNKNEANFFVKSFGCNNVNTVTEIQQKIQEGGEDFLCKISYVTKNIVGSDGYFRNKREELLHWIRFHVDAQHGPPNFFITLSCAEYYWPDLIHLVNERIGFATGKMGMLAPNKPGIVKAMNEYSVVVQEFFHIRVEEWLKTVGKQVFDIEHYWIRYEFAPSRGQIHAHLLAICNNQKVLHNMNLHKHDNRKRADILHEWAMNHGINADVSITHPTEEGLIEQRTFDKDNHPCACRFSECKDRKEDADNMKHAVLYHHCSSYCMRADSEMKGKDR